MLASGTVEVHWFAAPAWGCAGRRYALSGWVLMAALVKGVERQAPGDCPPFVMLQEHSGQQHQVILDAPTDLGLYSFQFNK